MVALHDKFGIGTKQKEKEEKEAAKYGTGSAQNTSNKMYKDEEDGDQALFQSFEDVMFKEYKQHMKDNET